MEVITITANNFEAEVKNSDKPVLIDFWAAWCGPCQMVAPVIEQLAAEIPNIKFGKVNVDEERELQSMFAVASIPTFILFKDGQAAGKLIGMQPKDAIINFLK